MSRTCKRVVYKKVKRSCKNALVGGAGFFANNDNVDKVAVKAFIDAIAKLIPVKEQQNKIDATKYYAPITIDQRVFYNNICLYAFIILYCAIVHNFKIEPSQANKDLIDKNILKLLRDALIKLLNQYVYNDDNQILESLENNKFGEIRIIYYLFKHLNININVQDAIITFAYLVDDDNNKDTENFANVNMNKLLDDKDLISYLQMKFGQNVLDTKFEINKMLITIPQPPKEQSYTYNQSNEFLPNKFDNDVIGQEALRQRIKAQQQ